MKNLKLWGLLLLCSFAGYPGAAEAKSWSEMTQEEKINFLYGKVRGDNVVLDAKTDNFEDSDVGYGTNVAIGYNNKPLNWIKTDGKKNPGNHRVMLGYNNQAVHNGFAMGDSNMVYGSQSVAIGYQSWAMGHDAIALGVGAYALPSTEVKNLAYGSRDFQARNVAVGENAVAAASSSAYGPSSAALGQYSLAMGTQAIAGGDNANSFTGSLGSVIAAAKGLVTDEDVKSAYGEYLKNINYDQMSSYEQELLMDRLRAAVYLNQTPSIATTALGALTRASGSYATAVGALSQANGASSLAAGRNAHARADESVALGAFSVADRAALTEEEQKEVFLADVPGVAGTVYSTKGAVSIGSTDDGPFNRQLTGLAAGREANDAVNVAQLQAAMVKVVDHVGGGVKYFSVRSQGGGNENNDGAKGADSIAVGKDAVADLVTPHGEFIRKETAPAPDRSVVVGNEAVSQDVPRSVAIGHKAKVTWYTSDRKVVQNTAEANIAIGDESLAAATRTIAVGKKATVDEFAYDAVAIGTNAHSAGRAGVALGLEAENLGTGSGWNFDGKTQHPENASIAIGAQAKTKAISGIAIGRAARSNASNSVVIGSEAETLTENAARSVVIGFGAHGEGNGDVIVGWGARAEYKEPYTDHDSFHRYAVAVGTGAKTKHIAGTALGYNSKAEERNSVALGSNSIADTLEGVAGYDPVTNQAYEYAPEELEKQEALREQVNALVDRYTAAKTDEERESILAEYTEAIAKFRGVTSTFISNVAAVSVGDKTGNLTRQITNVAAGFEDTDAVNVAQLKRVRELGIGFKTYSNNDLTKETGSVSRPLGEIFKIVGKDGVDVKVENENIVIGLNAEDIANNPALKGPKGDTGAKGDKGEPGVKGDKGDTGAKGDKGEPGAKGDKGDTGAKGDKGEPGVKGDKGDTGAKGDKGEPGVKGDKGDTGAKGDKGEPGVKGDKGDTGAKGDKGEPGVKGDKGDTGAKGDKGDTGAKGDKGDTGAKGDKGDTGAKGDKGDTGAKGDKGDTGAKGDKGDSGTKGDRGDSGAEGRGVKKVEVKDGALVVTYNDGTTEEAGLVGGGSSNGLGKAAVQEMISASEAKQAGRLAQAVALGSLLPLDYDEEKPTQIAVGFGYQSGQTGFALGLLHYLNRDALVHAGVALGSDDPTYRLGATLRVGASPKYQSRKVSSGDYALLHKIERLSDSLTEKDQRIVEMQQKLENLETVVEQLLKDRK